MSIWISELKTCHFLLVPLLKLFCLKWSLFSLIDMTYNGAILMQLSKWK
jgi:hypothetical protein